MVFCGSRRRVPRCECTSGLYKANNGERCDRAHGATQRRSDGAAPQRDSARTDTCTETRPTSRSVTDNPSSSAAAAGSCCQWWPS